MFWSSGVVHISHFWRSVFDCRSDLTLSWFKISGNDYRPSFHLSVKKEQPPGLLLPITSSGGHLYCSRNLHAPNRGKEGQISGSKLTQKNPTQATELESL